MNMEKARAIITAAGVFILLFSSGNMPGNSCYTIISNPYQASSKPVQTQTKPKQTSSKAVQKKTTSTQANSKTVQTKTKSTQAGSKSTQIKSKTNPAASKTVTVNKVKYPGTVRIGKQNWAIANLDVYKFRNGDSIPEAKTNKEWVTAGESGKPAWCFYNNDPATGKKYGKLYNWYAVNDSRGLAPSGWSLPSDTDWTELTYYLGGQNMAGKKMKTTSGWTDGNNGTNEIGFTGLPGGYRVENGTFLNLGSIATWWSTTESKSRSAIDYYLLLSSSFSQSSSPRQRGESVRCLRK
jgi:uncharacterized protein (TIGR02145 family)